ncbi:PHOMO B domain-containing protein [Mycena kentingensis (nom. inval.)]|nr:PHOMO B domain-containing protein [Mycena kentingensis (nom. inval.)]
MRALIALCLCALSLVSATKHNYATHAYYVVETLQPAEVSRELGVEIVGRAGELPNHWLVRAPKLSARDDVEGRDHVLERRAGLRRDGGGTEIKYLARQTLRQRVKRAPIPQEDENTRAAVVAQRLGIADPLFDQQWHILNEEEPVHSMNVVPVWDMGFTGKGIISSFIDDGLDYTSDDLKDAFDAEDSYDFNDHEPLPTPKLPEDSHGTRCAGQVAAGKNNVCGIGIAYNSKVAAVRILSGPISDVDEAAALNYGFQNVSIYSCSWGPPDNGQTMEGGGYLINKAVLHGVNEGRGGKGSIFVFAAGNGAGSGDQCNFDGYTNSIYSVTVAAVGHLGQHPYYSEPCTANLVTAYSSGDGKSITTTDRGKNKCTSSHGGTSAAAPNAVGVFALALEARPELTWRDIQHLCVETARQINHDDDWELTAAGRNYSSKYGYGTLDGAAFVTAARKWKLVNPQARVHTKTIQIEDGRMAPMGNFSGGEVIGVGGVSSVMSIKWDTLQDANFEKLEHITVRVWIDHARRGDVRIELRSPGGITSVLAEPRKYDAAKTGFPGWTMMSVKHWGEDPVGDWLITVSDVADPEHRGKFLGWDMVLWGSAIDPKKATLYELSHEDPLLPPNDEPTPMRPVKPSATISRVKPTAFLTDAAAVAETSAVDGTKVGSGAAVAASSASSANSQLTRIIEGLKARLATTIFALFILSFVLGVVIYWRCCHQARPVRPIAGPYTSLPDENDHAQMADRGRRVSVAEDDSDDEADERTGLNRNSGHVGFHSGFLDDDDEEHDHEYPPSAAAGQRAASPAYRDDDSEHRT